MYGSGLTAWYDPDAQRWYRAHLPRVTLTATSLTELAALPERIQADLHRNDIAVGLLAYDAGLLLHGISGRHGDHAAPLAQVYIYEGERVEAGPLPAGDAIWRLTTPFQSDRRRADHLAGVDAIHRYLRAGDCYQVNYARRFSARCEGNPWAAWLALAAAHPAPHASFFALDEATAVFGVSPERFLRLRDGVLTTEPIKGSRPRGASPQEDDALARALTRSTKDRAENLMIVDLLRNDLGQVCVPGSIVADPLFELRRFSNVQHLVSTVTGRLRAGVAPLQALLACFPGGSITGAPKKRAMEIIDELEPAPRGFYCGTQFWLDGHGNMDANILIRTFQQYGDHIVCHGGGGIVADSVPAVEFEESEFKVAALLRALGAATAG